VSPHDDAHKAERNRQIQAMFARIVPRYDRLNRLMTFGMDGRWRAAAAQAAEPAGKRILDLGIGTGDLARELSRRGAAQVCGADFTPEMLRTASSRGAERRMPDGPHALVAADAHRLPFADASFDAVTSGFLLRNLTDLPVAFREMARVLRPGGRVVCLDMTPAPPGPFAWAFGLYFRRIMPPVAGLISGDRAAYGYLSRSLQGFPDADALSALLRDAGFRDVRYRRLGGGAVALHVGVRC
jgi:demethylmenaquinone methyltransferase/2-methoxy-6-polyprenyl-1,4-benzoquinol methylase